MWFVERRRYFRIKGPNIKVGYVLADEEGRLNSGLATGLVWDLSGDGIALFIHSEKNVKPKSGIKLEIVLIPMEIMGEAVKCAHQKQKKKKYLLGIYFISIDEANRGKIVNYVVQEQLASLKK